MEKKLSNQNDNRLRVLRCVGMMLVLVPLLIGAVSATTWYVDDDGGAGINFTKIQEAVDAAQNNDTIIVYNGTYEENVVLKKSLTLQGEDRENTIIDNSSGNGVQIATDNCVIRGLTIRSCEDSGIAIYSSSNNIISNNIITLNGRHGIKFRNSSDNTIINNSIFSNDDKGISLHHHSNNNMIANNTVHSIIGGSDCDGIEVTISSYNVISDNEIFDCDDEGIELDGSSHNTITNNTIYSNTEVGIDVRGSLYNYIANNTIYLNGGNGIDLVRSWDTEPVVWGSSYNTITSNVIYSNDDDGMELENSCNNIIFNNTLYGNDDTGIETKNSTNNHIYNNNLIYNDEQAYDDGNNNSWDNGPIIGGNYWCDHECVGNPSDGSQPYYIGRDGIDRYPFEDPIGEFPSLPPPRPKSHINVNKEEYLSTSDTHISHNKIYNFNRGWSADLWEVNNLANVTYTITTTKNFRYINNYELYQNGIDRSFILPPTIEGQNYTWILPLRDRIGSSISFVLDSSQTIQDNPWVDMDVDTTNDNDYTRVNITVTPVIPLSWLSLDVRGDKIIDVLAYPSDFKRELFTSNCIEVGSWEINQGQTYEFSILVKDPDEVNIWLDSTFGWVEEQPSDTITLPVTELGSVTVNADVPVKWEHRPAQPQYVQYITIEFLEKKASTQVLGAYQSIFGTIKPSYDITEKKCTHIHVPEPRGILNMRLQWIKTV